MNMKKQLLISILFIVSALYAGVNLLTYSVKSQDGNIVISWQTASETNLRNYVIERRTVKGNFIELASIEPRADKTYEYVDKSAYKSSDAVYVYKVVCVDNDGSVSDLFENSVAHNVSSVKRTWGSIKALFR